MTEKQFLKDLENKLWKTADTLRSNISAAEYKHIVLGLVFVKYVSDSFVFLNSSNEPFRDSHRIRDHHWKRALEKCGIEYRRLYDTRSTFATMMVSSNLYSVNC